MAEGGVRRRGMNAGSRVDGEIDPYGVRQRKPGDRRSPLRAPLSRITSQGRGLPLPSAFPLRGRRHRRKAVTDEVSASGRRVHRPLRGTAKETGRPQVAPTGTAFPNHIAGEGLSPPVRLPLEGKAVTDEVSASGRWAHRPLRGAAKEPGRPQVAPTGTAFPNHIVGEGLASPASPCLPTGLQLSHFMVDKCSPPWYIQGTRFTTVTRKEASL